MVQVLFLTIKHQYMNTRYIAALAAGALLLAAPTAFAQTGQQFGIGFAVSDSVAPGAGKTLATIELNGLHSSSTVSVASVPVTVVGVGANFTNCRVTTTSDLNTSLTTGAHGVQMLSGTNVFTFDTPQQVPSEQIKTYAVRCDVSALAPVGSQLTLSVVPANVSATDATGATITPTAALDPYGAPRSMYGTLFVRAAGTPGAPNTGAISTTSTPGAPNTGAGGDLAENLAILLASALVAVVGSRYLLRSRR